MEIRIELTETVDGKIYRGTRQMDLDYIQQSTFPQHLFYTELMEAVRKMQEAQQEHTAIPE